MATVDITNVAVDGIEVVSLEMGKLLAGKDA
jgi:hypothetical protein